MQYRASPLSVQSSRLFRGDDAGGGGVSFTRKYWIRVKERPTTLLLNIFKFSYPTPLSCPPFGARHIITSDGSLRFGPWVALIADSDAFHLTFS